MKIKNTRKVIFINKPFQISILSWFAILGILICLVFYFANLYFFKSMHEEAVLAGLAPDNIFFQYLSGQKQTMNKIFFTSIIFSCAIIGWGGMYLSHKVAGPIHRLTQHLNTNNFNDAKPLKFRNKDYFPEIESAFNEFIKRK